VSNGSSSWCPAGFELYRERYPATPPLAQSANDITPEFMREWDAADTALPASLSTLTCVLVRGIFGSWIPRHFAVPLERLRRSGLRALIAQSRATGTIAVNAASLRADLDARLPEGRLLFLCHSKGGLDLLAMLATAPELRARTAGITLCQTPRAGCAVLESVLLGAHRESAGIAQRARERVAKAAIAISGARPACLELTSPRLQEQVMPLTRLAAELPVLSVATWSSEPTAWLDSQHARLAQIRPGCAHDGLFYLEDLIWPCGRQVLLPRIDHAQMCVGGGDFDHGRFWVALARLFR
jgi:hypothetical protein